MNADIETNEHFTIHNVWQRVDPLLADEIATFWLEQKALADRRHAIERSQQVVFLAREVSGKIVGVMTAYKHFNQGLEHYFYYTRVFIQTDYRRLNIMSRFALAVFPFFEMRYCMGLDADVIGLFSETENPVLQQQIRHAVHLGGYVYIGKGEGGSHLRVRYFVGAQI